MKNNKIISISSLKTQQGGSIYASLDEAKWSNFHWKTVIVSGMGFFTDAYDLFIIGIVTTILAPIWHLTLMDLMWLNSTSLLASVVGALVFGKLMDKLGRKTMYGIETAILAFGALFSAFSTNVWQLIIFRIILGLGIGGDYPGSAVIASEYANRTQRGKMVSLVFAMQGLGLIVGPALALILFKSGIAHDIVWRLMLGFGAIPAISVFYLRRKIKETPRYTLEIKGDLDKTHETLAWATGVKSKEKYYKINHQNHKLLNKTYAKRLIGTAGTWFLLDVAFYGTGISSQLIFKTIMPNASLFTSVLVSGLIFLIAAVPGYIFATFLIDKIGRKHLQWQGFMVMGILYLLLALIPGIATNPVIFLPLYGLTYFFIEFGPNTTTFVYPSEIFPAKLRGFAHGISAATGKLGAFLAAFLMPQALLTLHLSLTMGILATVSFSGLFLTIFTLPEPKGKSLEQASEEITIETKETIVAV